MSPAVGTEYPVTLTLVEIGPAHLGANYDWALLTFIAPNGEPVNLTCDPRLLGGAS